MLLTVLRSGIDEMRDLLGSLQPGALTHKTRQSESVSIDQISAQEPSIRARFGQHWVRINEPDLDMWTKDDLVGRQAGYWMPIHASCALHSVVAILL